MTRTFQSLQWQRVHNHLLTPSHWPMRKQFANIIVYRTIKGVLHTIVLLDVCKKSGIVFILANRNTFVILWSPSTPLTILITLGTMAHFCHFKNLQKKWLCGEKAVKTEAENRYHPPDVTFAYVCEKKHCENVLAFVWIEMPSKLKINISDKRNFMGCYCQSSSLYFSFDVFVSFI